VRTVFLNHGLGKIPVSVASSATPMATKSHSSGAPKEAFTLSKHRIEGLSDGLFAIVMTLLVLDLKVPEIEGRVGAHELLHALGSNWRVFISFWITFCLAALFWLIQQRIFVVIRAVDRASLFFSLASMLFVSLLPFAASLFGRYSYNPTAMTLYFADQFGIALFIALLWARTVHTNNLVDMEKADQTRMSVRVYSIAASGFVATLVGIFKPDYAALGFLVPVALGRLYQKKFLHL
jgi:uncharacterized membrane protein